MTDTNILNKIPIRKKEQLLEGNICTAWLPLDVDRRIGQILLDDERPRQKKPRRSDIYRHCLKEGLKVLKGMSVEQIRQADANWTAECRKMPCGFDIADNVEIYKLRQKTGIRRDLRIRRLAIRIGCELLFD